MVCCQIRIHVYQSIVAAINECPGSLVRIQGGDHVVADGRAPDEEQLRMSVKCMDQGGEEHR